MTFVHSCGQPTISLANAVSWSPYGPLIVCLSFALAVWVNWARGRNALETRAAAKFELSANFRFPARATYIPCQVVRPFCVVPPDRDRSPSGLYYKRRNHDHVFVSTPTAGM